MGYLDRDEETICAQATAPGISGISVVRLSGPSSASVARKIFNFLPQSLESHRVYYGWAKSIESKDIIDEVLVSYFSEGKSFTGQSTFEVSCHGSPYIVSRLITELVKSGARLAEKGEFTYRAFINGRIDLAQAESVLSLIESKSKKSSELALRQLKGDLSKRFIDLEDRLLNLLAHLEVNIDYSEEDLEVIPVEKVKKDLNFIHSEVSGLLESYDQGRVIRSGMIVAFVGAPNVGKSSLLNMMAQEEKAIVTEVEGTTRDLVEEHLIIDGIEVLFVDTAGLRETEDQVEKIGISRSLSALAKADIIVWVGDKWDDSTKKNFSAFIDDNFETIKLKKLTFLLNKIDKIKEIEPVKAQVSEFIESYKIEETFFTSATRQIGREDIIDYIKSLILKDYNEGSTQVSQQRQFELLSKIYNSIDKTLNSVKEDLSPELVIFELQESIIAIHEILGKEFDDQVMDRVFKQFCLGK